MPDQQILKRLSDSASLMDVLIQMEDFLDGLDLYVFKNWYEGEVVDGPTVERYWVSMTLKYEYEQMPDPAGGMRLLKHGAKVAFRKEKEEEPQEITGPSDYQEGRPGKPKMQVKDVWLVDIQIPRHFIEELDDQDLELYDDNADLDLENISDARDEDIDDTDAFKDDESGEATDDSADDSSDDEEI